MHLYFIDKSVTDPKLAVAAVKKARDKSQAKEAARAQGFTFLDQLEENQGCVTRKVTRVEYDMRGFLRQCLEKYESLVDKPVVYKKVSAPFHDDKIARPVGDETERLRGNSRPSQAEC